MMQLAPVGPVYQAGTLSGNPLAMAAGLALLRQLDDLVAGLGDFAWEVGPGGDAENAFTLSPGGDRELLAETQTIVDAAPVVPGWEFHSAKPPRKWEPRFALHDADGEPFEVDATGWRCALLIYADGTHEVVVEAPNLASLPQDYQRWAAELALDGLLGERRRLEVIDDVTVVAEFSDKESAAAFPMADVRDRVGSRSGRTLAQ